MWLTKFFFFLKVLHSADLPDNWHTSFESLKYLNKMNTEPTITPALG